MKKLLLYKTIIIALALIGLYPVNAISRELDAVSTVVNYMSAAKCIFWEGLMTREDAATGMLKALEELEGISEKKMLVIIKNEDFTKKVEERINQSGGCVKAIEDFERWELEHKKSPK